MIQSVLSTLVAVTVPLCIPVIAGVLLVKFLRMDTKPIMTLVLYFLTPVMLFDKLFHAQLSFEDVGITLLFCLMSLALLWAAAKLVGRLLRLDAPDIAGLTLIATLMNSGNYGIPLVLLAFGDLGVDKASVFVVMQMLATNTLGVFFAARSNFTFKKALLSVFTLPAVYAAVLAVGFRFLNVTLPQSLESGVDMVSQAFSPVVLTVLGAQMASVRRPARGEKPGKAFAAGLSLRMLIAPILAFLNLKLLGAQGLLFAVLFVLASMPVSVNSVILADKFDASKDNVSRCILWTTLASLIVLPVLITLVK